MDLYFLNFKQILIILTVKDQRAKILKDFKNLEIEANLKFVDGYFEAATLIDRQKHDPYDHIIMNLSVSNRKFKDFMEYIEPMVAANENFLIEYTKDGQLKAVSNE